MRVLVTGASGAVGSSIIPQLVRSGHQVVGCARNIDRITADCIRVRADLDSGEGLDDSMAGCDVAYYLVHAMETSSSELDFVARERQQAENFRDAAQRNGIKRVIYLGVLTGEHAQSDHLDSRQAVEQVLSDSANEVVLMRASIVIAASSRSFRLLVRLVERLPVLALPPWRAYKTHPLDERDLVAGLLASLTCGVPTNEPLQVDMGGPVAMTYQQIMEKIADLMMVRRPTAAVPFNLPETVATVASLIAQEDRGLVGPLMHGLTGDILPRPEFDHRQLNVKLHSFTSSVERALRIWEESEPLKAR